MDSLREVACQLATEAARLIVDERPDQLGVAATKTSATDVVTEMDRRSEDLLRRRLEQLRPDDGLLGEEGTSSAGTSGITWVVDPIDGTVNYLYEIPAYAVSVAACTGDAQVPESLEPVAAAVVNPMTRELFHAARGEGAWCTRDERTWRLAVNAPVPLAQALLGTGFGYAADKRRRQGAVVAELLPVVRDIRRAGSAALDLCAVAAGRLDVYFESGLNPWDRLGGQLLVTEAGGVVLGADGGPASGELTVAGAAETVAALTALRLQ
ncbi:inositol monophosphatase [Calidifontibacter sp. DB0510]|uniref:Inositol-1-monophosphatase n=1 Tax=Metallococcus carri TaxID=1656884 RepID=A0A967EFS1_9MICO|nr:inositol monophosphatase family protein [Metallococcus carri]NHN56896.1 inositol monophosphatase [Metallococcus carri]NOP37641.1 inositol monophosphatase [Calidifontibacter sp. DB2511S]